MGRTANEKSAVDAIRSAWAALFCLCFLTVILMELRGSMHPVAIAAAALLIAFSLFFGLKWEIPKFGLWIFCAAFLVRLAVILCVPTPAESDFSLLFSASESLINGDRTFLNDVYFQNWTYQVGMVAWQAVFLKLWDNILMLKIVNCVICSLTVLLVYLIASEIASKKAAQTAAILYCFLPFPLFYTVILSNQFPASFFIYAAFWIAISKRLNLKKWIRYLIFGVLLALANVLRPESIIPLFAAVLMLIFSMRRGNWRENLLCAAIAVISYMLLFRLISAAFSASGLAPGGLTNNAVYWKFLLGLNQASGGGYSNDDTVYLGNSAAAWAKVRSRAAAPLPQLIKLFMTKMRTFWSGGSVDWTFAWCMNEELSLFGRHFTVAGFANIATEIIRLCSCVIYAFVVLGCLRLVRRGGKSDGVMLLIDQTFVTSGVYMLIEVQQRYIYGAQIGVIILSALGVQALRDITAKKK